MNIYQQKAAVVFGQEITHSAEAEDVGDTLFLFIIRALRDADTPAKARMVLDLAIADLKEVRDAI